MNFHHCSFPTPLLSSNQNQATEGRDHWCFPFPVKSISQTLNKTGLKSLDKKEWLFCLKWELCYWWKNFCLWLEFSETFHKFSSHYALATGKFSSKLAGQISRNKVTTQRGTFIYYLDVSCMHNFQLHIVSLDSATDFFGVVREKWPRMTCSHSVPVT